VIRKKSHNIVLEIGWLNGFVSTEAQNLDSVLLFNFSYKNPSHRQYMAGCMEPYPTQPACLSGQDEGLKK
jgi:hypothetical protein